MSSWRIRKSRTKAYPDAHHSYVPDVLVLQRRRWGIWRTEETIAGFTAIGMGVGLPALFVAVAVISWTSPDPWWFSLLWSVVTVMISVGAPRIARRAADGIALTGLRSDPKTSLDRSVRLHERLLDEVGALDDETRDNALNDPEVLQALSVAADLRSDAERRPSWETFTEYRQAARHAACIAERFDPRR